MPDSIYLSAHDVIRIAHHAHWIPAGRGWTSTFMATAFPGWSFNEIYPPLKGAGVLTSRAGEFSARHLPPGVIGVEVDRRGRVTTDDGSSRSPARLASWERNDGDRISEHLAVSSLWPGPVIVHTPHTSRHIPTADRSAILLSDTALAREIRLSTDVGVDRVARLLHDDHDQVTLAAASLSRLVFDPERFSANDPTESTGRGLVYTRTATGRRLRADLDEPTLDWFRQHHRHYTRSVEHVVRRSLERHGRVLIIDLHSYTVEPLAHEDPLAPRPEICLGTDVDHTPAALVDVARSTFGVSFDVAIDTPYSGAYVPGRLHSSGAPVSSIMVEIRRDVLRSAAGRRLVARRIHDIVDRWTDT
jgi:N-formylglutamate deformylase